MKLRQVKLFTVMVLALTCVAQSAVPEPEIADIFYRLDGDKLIPLERQAAAFHSNCY